MAIEDMVRDWNINEITDFIHKELTDRVAEALSKK